MYPTDEQIRLAAYHRWLRRGARHGGDRDDWLAAEQGAFFAANYEPIARHRLDGPEVVLPAPRRHRCRFCERSPEEAEFSGGSLAVPASLGNTALLTTEQCDDCREAFAEAIEADLARFVGRYRGGDPGPGAGSFAPVAAYKGLVRSALLLLPNRELDAFSDAVEWLANPDHGLDLGAIGPLDCVVSLLEPPAGSPWAALARRKDDEAAVPYILAFFGVGRAVFEIPLPFCSRDEEIDGDRVDFPRVASPIEGEGGDVAETIVLKMASLTPPRP